jgi:hypothetical protein
MKLVFSLLTFCSFAAMAQLPTPPAPGERADIVIHKMIGDKGAHNAFTDIIRWENLWYVCYRVGDAHVGGNGQIQVLASYDGLTWSPVATVKEEGIDLRDPKFSITKEKRLILFMGGSIYNGTQLTGRQPRVSTSTDGRTWLPPQKFLSSGDWLWRATWHEGEQKFYGTSYHTHPTTPGPKEEAEWSLKLYSSLDGKVWQLTSIWDIPGRPNEATVRLLPDGDMMAMVRREAGDRKGWIGKASPPFKQWAWQPLSVPLGGPNFIVLPDGRIIGGSRGFGATPGPHMVLFEIKDGQYVPLIELPSGGDCSYPGMAFHEDHLHVSYYSSHEDKKSKIYFAKVKLK